MTERQGAAAGARRPWGGARWGRARPDLLVLSALIAIGCAGCGKEEQTPQRGAEQPVAQDAAAPAPAKRVVILGFDGVEPTIVEAMMEQGQLPNLSKLRERGTYSRLGTTTPPQSPVAWSSFATGKHPDGHGIFDFLVRDPSNYRPSVGYGQIFLTALAPDGSVKTPARQVTARIGRTFWDVADEQGVRARVLNVPFVAPPDHLTHGKVLCGLGIFDIRGMHGLSFSIAEEHAQVEKIPGGLRLPLRFQNGVAKVGVPGYAAPRRRSDDAAGRSNKYVELPLVIEADRDKHTATVRLGSKTLSLQVGQWSEWVESSLQVTAKFTVHAISRFNLIKADSQVELYMTCLQYHPRQPLAEFASPPDYAAELADRYGLYKTVGWAYDTGAVRQETLTEAGFLADIKETMTWRERLTLDELDRNDSDLLISVWTATDRVAHLFWRFRDPQHPLYTEEGARQYGDVVEKTYRRMDEIVGKVAQRISDKDLFMVLSDHGFGTFRTEFNVNAWLVRNGYATVIGQQDAATAVGNRPYLQDFDWSRTRAYSMGLSAVYLNLIDRERDGIVRPEEAQPLVQEIRRELLEATDPATGETIFAEVYTSEGFAGAGAARAPDLLLAFKNGYQMSRIAATGAVPEGLFAPCLDKWSGEHAAYDHRQVPGILFANLALSEAPPEIIDLAPTALRFLGKAAPPDFQGKSLLP